MAQEKVPDLVTVPWLQEQMRFDKVKVMDASWWLVEKMEWHKEYVKKRIPGSVFFDVEKISDPSTDLPHMIPPTARYEQTMEELGILPEDHVVIYDRTGLYIASARAWWTMKIYGHRKLSLLEGGLGAWEKAKGPIVSGDPPLIQPRGPYKSSFNPELLTKFESVVNLPMEKRKQLVDARSNGRFNSTDPEPRPNVRRGRIEGSVNLPYPEFLIPLDGGPEKTFPPKEKMEEMFKKIGINLDEKVIASCGSGVTATVLCFGLHLLGKNWSLYDGSWTEYSTLVPPDK